MEKIITISLGMVTGMFVLGIYNRIADYIQKKRNEKDELHNELRNLSNNFYNHTRTIDILREKITQLENTTKKSK